MSIAISPVLSPAQHQHFLEHGHVVLHDCFSGAQADELVADAWQQLRYDPHDSATWKQALRIFPPSRSQAIREFSPLVWSAICELVGGQERVASVDNGIGLFVINFRDASDQAWTPPGPRLTGWHKDGNHFRHFLNSPEQGLLVLPLLSDVAARGGGTVLACDSVPLVARYLREHPEGVRPEHLDIMPLVAQCQNFVEFSGRVGDVALIHPFVLHSGSQNHSGTPRFMLNINVELKAPMNFSREDGNNSPVETAVLRGVGVQHLDFIATGSRERVTPGQ